MSQSSAALAPAPAAFAPATNALATPSFERLSPRNFARLAELIHDYSGIKMPATKQTMLALRLRGRLADLDLPDLDAYTDYLFQPGGRDAEMVHLIDAVSTNKTDFFREPAHFDFLREQALPEFAAAGKRQLKFWSSAASVGAEAYTLAMVAEEFRRQNHGPDYTILATDICTAVLSQAVSGRYPRAMLEPVPPDLRARYVLQPCDPGIEEVRIAPQLRAKLAFARLNLMEARYPVPRDMDLIFCRNVLIYFDKPTQTAVLTRLCEHLAPGGYLILGHSESAAGAGLPVAQIFNTIFRKS